MISNPALCVEPWSVHETSLSLAHLARMESIFALSNGHIGVRGNLDEGEPHGLPGTYLNGVFELRPQPYAEPDYGSPESGRSSHSFAGTTRASARRRTTQAPARLRRATRPGAPRVKVKTVPPRLKRFRQFDGRTVAT